MDTPDEKLDVQKSSRTRREFIVALAGSAAGFSVATVNAQADVGTEGIFLIAERSNRIFFIRSAWLPYFEVTDHIQNTELDGNDPQSLIKRLRQSNYHNKEKWDVLYSNDIGAQAGALESIAGDQLPAPKTTYIAMSVSPSVTPP